ncbi:hypothetical protein COLSTE_01691 [Collinsella stercoris DSM 13279]|uniref:Uncharacterized protein n=1 Tax=Collinsella stercoris DSM 13279 TaxID=445975 RepID=B6GC72_9ACTN|nr:hypothetical protein COLSTE_01691 [Collinsella stercoris DSM 13279]
MFHRVCTKPTFEGRQTLVLHTLDAPRARWSVRVRRRTRERSLDARVWAGRYGMAYERVQVDTGCRAAAGRNGSARVCAGVQVGTGRHVPVRAA